MRESKVALVVRSLSAMLIALTVFGAGSARASGNPDFGAVTWTPLGCDSSDLVSHTSPSAFDFAGDATFPAAFFTHDGSYLYFRYRMDGNPASAGGFAQGAWTALMQVPSGNAFQYQYELALNGKSDTIEIWQNTVAQDISFSPLFHDTPEVKIFSQGYAFSSGSTVNTTPLARSLATGDGSHFGGGTDYFVDFAFPVSVMVANGLISSAADLDDAVFFPATSTDPNNYNKGHLNCPFLPVAGVTLDKTVAPTAIPVNTTTSVTYTLVVGNDGPGIAKGLDVTDPALPAFFSNPIVDVSSDDASVSWMVISTSPLEVKIPTLPAGSTVTIHLTADATPHCGDGNFMNTASVSGVDAENTTGSVLLDVQSDGPEVCDGVDNNCNGQVDEGGDALCDDGNPCTVDSCGGQAGCAHDPIPGCVPCSTPSDCSDGNACTTETCNAGVCGHDPIPGCTPCSTPSDCNDGNACTTETCNAGVCGHDPIPGCTPCSTPSDCNDGNACTTETCVAGVCGHNPIPGCTPCSTPSDCNDGNACTTETCNGGVCGHDPIPGCTPCSTPSDCDDANACTTETCVGGVCGHVTPDPTCVPCTSASQCGDGNGCTTDECTEGICTHVTPDPSCVPCTTADDCNDHNGCTTDTCNAGGVCEHSAPPGCIPCTTDAQCNDDNPCTTDACGNDGSCRITAIPGCQRCTTAADCNDSVACTIDTCSGGVCAHERTAQCDYVPENCSDGVDNDGDGLVDCADPDCANAPECRPHEICGNCIDDDGNGLVDGEDPACCDATPPMAVRRLMLKTGTALATGRPIRGNHLRLKSRYAMPNASLLDPTTGGTEIQVSDGHGQIFCANIPAGSWKHPHRRVFRFLDKSGSVAGGLQKGRFKIKRNGKIVFKTRGKKMILRPTDGRDVKVTIRVGNVCATESMNLRAKRQALVFP